jgi:D-3-phosphoglycerate dehydrogenase
VGPVVLGLNADFDPTFDHRQAKELLEEKGIAFVDRETDESKGYGESMTVDLISGDENELRRVSVRGTITEGTPMVSRIDDFDGLYFDPRGNSVLVSYQDRPGMLSAICGVMARHEINIEDIRAPHNLEKGDSLAVLQVNQPVADEVCAEVVKESGAYQAIALAIK